MKRGEGLREEGKEVKNVVEGEDGREVRRRERRVK